MEEKGGSVNENGR